MVVFVLICIYLFTYNKNSIAIQLLFPFTYGACQPLSYLLSAMVLFVNLSQNRNAM